MGQRPEFRPSPEQLRREVNAISKTVVVASFDYGSETPFTDRFGNDAVEVSAISQGRALVMYPLQNSTPASWSGRRARTRVFENGQKLLEGLDYFVRFTQGGCRIYAYADRMGVSPKVIAELDHNSMPPRYNVFSIGSEVTGAVLEVQDIGGSSRMLTAFLKAPGKTYYKPMVRGTDYAVQSGPSGLSKVIVAKTLLSGSRVCVVDRRSYYAKRITVSNPGADYVKHPLFRLPLHQAVGTNGELLPLPIEREEDLDVWLNGERLTLGRDYRVKMNTGTDWYPELRLKGMLDPQDVLEVETGRPYEPSTGSTAYATSQEHAILGLDGSPLPITPKTARGFSKGRRVDVETLTDNVVRLEAYGSDELEVLFKPGHTDALEAAAEYHTGVNDVLPEVGFARNSVAWMFGVSYPVDEPRFVDPSQSDVTGMLIEEGTVNLIASPYDLTGSGWITAGSGIATTKDYADGPTPTSPKASRLVYTPALYGDRRTSVALTAGTANTTTVWLKSTVPGSTNSLRLFLYDSANNVVVGTTITTTDEYLPYSITGTPANSGAGSVRLAVALGTPAFDVLVWGVQSENKSSSTSTATGTRAVETLSIPTEGLLNSQKGSVILAFQVPRAVSVPLLDLGGTSQASGMYAQINSTGKLQFRVSDGTALKEAATSVTLAADTLYYAVFRWSPVGASVAIAGAIAGQYTGALAPGLLTDAILGGLTAGTTRINGVIPYAVLYDDVLSDSESIAASLGSVPTQFTASVRFTEGKIEVVRGHRSKEAQDVVSEGLNPWRDGYVSDNSVTPVADDASVNKRDLASAPFDEESVAFFLRHGTTSHPQINLDASDTDNPLLAGDLILDASDPNFAASLGLVGDLIFDASASGAGPTQVAAPISTVQIYNEEFVSYSAPGSLVEVIL
jgi:hypothetical protein